MGFTLSSRSSVRRDVGFKHFFVSVRKGVGFQPFSRFSAQGRGF